MNLLNVLVNELDEWPFSGKDIGQACDGSLHADPFLGRHTEFKLTVASDYADAVVTEKRWRKAIAKKAKAKEPIISLRDYFAAKAMNGMLAAPYHPASDEHMLARDAYTVADAMLAAREVSK